MLMKTSRTPCFPLLLMCLMTLGGWIRPVMGDPDAKRLYDDLLSHYNRLIRPVSNNSQVITVRLGLHLTQLIDLDLKNQILTTNVWVEHEWLDAKLTWDPEEYGGVDSLMVPSEHIWIPDIVLYNNADGEYVVTTMTKAILHYDGNVKWNPPAIFKSYCEIDVRYFPFDTQTCFMKFGSWSYSGLQMDLKHLHTTEDLIRMGMNLKDYYPSGEWDILDVPAERHARFYECCPNEFYADIFFNITLRRKTLFYTVNLIIPCVGISCLSVLTFYLPADSGEKVALCITTLLSQTMFFLLMSEIIPSTSLALPLLGKYLLFTMCLVGLSVLITIVILNVRYRKPSTHRMAPWVRKFFIQKLPKLLLMRVPTPSGESNRQEQPSQSLGPGEGAGGAVNEDDGVKRRNIQAASTRMRRLSATIQHHQQRMLGLSSAGACRRRGSWTTPGSPLPAIISGSSACPAPAPVEFGGRYGSQLLCEIIHHNNLTRPMAQFGSLSSIPPPPPPPPPRTPQQLSILAPMSSDLQSMSGSSSSSSLEMMRIKMPTASDIRPSSSSSTPGRSSKTLNKRFPIELQKAIRDVQFIQNHMKREDEYDEEDNDWGFIAMVLDRFFLGVFTLASLAGTISILLTAPALYDSSMPIHNQQETSSNVLNY